MADLGRTYVVDDMDLSGEIERDEDFAAPAAPLSDDKPWRAVNVDAALRLVQSGAFIFPCSVEKRPLLKAWNEKSTRDEHTIRAWWRGWPDAIPAIDCGKTGIVVIDMDRHGGPDGLQEFYDIVGDPTVFGAPMIETANGGIHIIFRAPPGERFGNSPGILKGRGIDARGDGGFIIAVGATLPDGRRWDAELGAPDFAAALEAGTLLVLPEQIAALLRSKPQREERPTEKPRTTFNGTTARQSGEREKAWAGIALTETARELAATGSGGRNHALNAAAFRLGRIVARGWLSEIEVRAGLEGACQRNGLWKEDGARSVRASLASGLRGGLAQPHEDLEDRPQDNEAMRLGAEIVAAYDTRARAAEHPELITVDGVTINTATGEILEDALPAAGDGQQRHGDEQQGHEQQHGQPEQQRQPNRSKVTINTVVASSLANQPVPKQEWLVEDLIPGRNVTLLSGDGGTGKSLLSLQLAAAVATGGSWIGYRPQAGRALFLSAEDEIEELHRRLARIEKLSRLTDLTIIPLAGEDAILAAPQGRDRLLQPTLLFKAVKHVVTVYQPTLLVLDTAADLFAGNENARTEVRTFISLLRGLCLKKGVTIVLLSHPSQAGLANGSGASGSTSWNNSVRSRLYFSRRIIDKVEDDPDLRVLEQMKSNRSRSGGQIVVRWKSGRFEREAESNLNARDAAAKAAQVFMALLSLFLSQDRTVSDKSGPNYAPAVLAKHPDADGVTKNQMAKAMERLFRDNLIAIEEIGPISRRQRRIVIVAQSAFHVEDEEDGESLEECEADDG